MHAEKTHRVYLRLDVQATVRAPSRAVPGGVCSSPAEGPTGTPPQHPESLMNRTLIGSLALVLATASVANAQAKPEPKQAGAAKLAALTWADLTGDWEGKTMPGNTDSVIPTLTTTSAADKKIWLNLPNRKPVAAHF